MKTEKTHFQFSHEDATISCPMHTRKERFAASDRAMAYLKKSPDAERLSLLDRLCDELEVNDFQSLDNLMLTWDQIKEMAENDISFGAHTVNHPILSRIPLDKAEYEIVESKKRIEENIGKAVTSFAYPFGKKAQYSSDLFPVLEKLGFKCAVTTETATNNQSTPLFELNRGMPWEIVVSLGK